MTPNELWIATGELPKLKLFSAMSQAAMQGQIKAGHFGLILPNGIWPLSDAVEIVPLAVREMALTIPARSEPPLEHTRCFSAGHPVMEQAFCPMMDEPDPFATKEENELRRARFLDGPLRGPCYLLWLPESRLVVEWFMLNRSARPAHERLRNNLDVPFVVFSRQIAAARKLPPYWAADLRRCHTSIDMPETVAFTEQFLTRPCKGCP